MVSEENIASQAGFRSVADPLTLDAEGTIQRLLESTMTTSIRSSDIDHGYLQNLRRMGTIEGISTLVLFGIAMPLKYLADMPLAVTVVGSIHGFLFLGLVGMLAVAVRRVPLPTGLAIAGVAAAVIPFGPFVLDRRLARLGDGDPSGA